MSDTAVAASPAKTTSEVDESQLSDSTKKSETFATFTGKNVAVFLKTTTTKDGEPGAYAVFKRSRKRGDTYEPTPFVNSLTDFDAIIETAVQGKIAMRNFYRQRDAQ